MKSIKLWAIIDTQKKTPRFCYADEEKSNGAMAVYDKRPRIPNNWKDVKRVVRVIISLKTDSDITDGLQPEGQGSKGY